MRAPRKKRLKLALILLSIAATVSACANGKPIILTAPTLCKDWPYLTRSKADNITKETAASMAASNAARPEYGCHPTRDEVAG